MMEFRKAKPGSDHTSEKKVWDIRGGRTAARHERRAAGLLMVCLLAALFGPCAQGAENNKNKVDLLIARNQVNDPYFHQSVVLMLPATETQLVVGLIINKPTHFTLAKIFPDIPEFKGRTDLAYFGGPVDIRTPSIVFRSPSLPDNAVKLYGNVYLTFDSDLISKAFQSPQGASTPRLFLGRAQWAPGQLDNEIRQGGWYRIQEDGDLVFSPHPDNLWPTLHARASPSKYIRYQLPPRGPQGSTWKAAAM
jgi:putative transcriptional regulator